MRDVVRQVTTFPELLRKLEVLVENEAGSPLTAAAKDVLESGVRNAILVYKGTVFATELDSRSTFHEIAEPLDRVIALLEDEANRDAVLSALGAPGLVRGRFSVDDTGTPIRDDLSSVRFLLQLGPEQGRGRRLVSLRRRRLLLAYLRAIARAVPQPPAPRGRGQPPTAESFREFVDRLATCWERASGTLFRSMNRPARFVHYVVEFGDATRPKESTTYMIKLIVAKRRAQISE
jgi:hypothetical protein